MAKREKRSPIKVGLLLDLDDYQTGMENAKRLSQSQGDSIQAALNSVADKITARFLSAQAAIAVAKKGYHEFIAKANELEKAGEGNEGTAAIARISAAADKLWTTFVRGALETKTLSTAVGALADGFDSLAAHLDSGARLLDLWGSGLDAARSATAGFLADIAGGIEHVARVLAGSFGAEGKALGAPAGAVADYAESLRKNLEKAQRSYEIESNKGFARFEKGATGYRSPSAMSTGLEFFDPEDDQDKLMREGLQDSLKRDAADQRHAAMRAGMFSSAGGSVVDTFVGSWEAGFARLGDLFQNFSKEVSDTFTGMSEATASALGETFSAAGTLGPMLQRVYGQSAEGAKRFQLAQMSLAGALSVVKGAQSTADGFKAIGDGDVGASVANFTAAGLYAGAAALAGVSAFRFAGSGGGAGQGVGVSGPSAFAQERQNITVIIAEAVGGEEFVENEVLPGLNKLAKRGVTLIAGHAQSADSLQPGRFPT